MYIHFVSLHYIHRQPSQKSLTLRYFFGLKAQDKTLRYCPRLYFKKQVFEDGKRNQYYPSGESVG